MTDLNGDGRVEPPMDDQRPGLAEPQTDNCTGNFSVNKINKTKVE